MPTIGPNLDWHKKKAMAKILTDLNNFRSEHLPALQGQGEILQEMKQEAVAWINANPKPTTLDDFPWIKEAIGVDGDTPAQVIQAWKTERDEWVTAARWSEKVRRIAANALKDATTKVEIDAVLSQFETAMNAKGH